MCLPVAPPHPSAVNEVVRGELTLMPLLQAAGLSRPCWIWGSLVGYVCYVCMSRGCSFLYCLNIRVNVLSSGHRPAPGSSSSKQKGQRVCHGEDGHAHYIFRPASISGKNRFLWERWLCKHQVSWHCVAGVWMRPRVGWAPTPELASPPACPISPSPRSIMGNINSAYLL